MDGLMALVSALSLSLADTLHFNSMAFMRNFGTRTNVQFWLKNDCGNHISIDGTGWFWPPCWKIRLV